MMRLSLALPCLLWCACAVESTPPPAALMEGAAEAEGVKGLERLDATAVRPASSPGFWEWTELGPAEAGHIDVSVDGANETRACFMRAGKLMLY